MNLKNFGKNLKELRINAVISQKELSEKSGIAQEMISRYETGKYIPTIKNVYKLATALECSADDLFK